MKKMPEASHAVCLTLAMALIKGIPSEMPCIHSTSTLRVARVVREYSRATYISLFGF